MSRTNLELDDTLVERAMRLYGLPSKKAAVELALRRLVGDAMSKTEALSMEGSGWEGNLEDFREGETPEST